MVPFLYYLEVLVLSRLITSHPPFELGEAMLRCEAAAPLTPLSLPLPAAPRALGPLRSARGGRFSEGPVWSSSPVCASIMDLSF